MVRRRDFLVGTGAVTGLLSAGGPLPRTSAAESTPERVHGIAQSARAFDESYEGEYLGQVAFPMGGLGAGMICLDGAGGLSKFSLRHRPDLEKEHRVFAALSIKGPEPYARVLEGPVPRWKLRPQFPGPEGSSYWGLGRFHQATFEPRFPFGCVQLRDTDVPLEVEITGWSPFVIFRLKGAGYFRLNGAGASTCIPV